MSSFSNHRIVKARKEYTCEWCYGTISVGKPCFRFVGNWEGVFQDWRMHPECEDSHQEETYEGEIHEHQHQRGRTCAETDQVRDEFEKEIAELIKEEVAKTNQGPLAIKGLAADILDLTEQWQEEETDRVEKLENPVKEEVVK